MNKLLCIMIAVLLIPFTAAFQCNDGDHIANAEPGYDLSYAVRFTQWYENNCKQPAAASDNSQRHNSLGGGTATKYYWRTIDEDWIGKKICVKQYFVRYNSYTGAETHYENRLRQFCINQEQYNPEGRWNKEKYGVWK